MSVVTQPSLGVSCLDDRWIVTFLPRGISGVLSVAWDTAPGLLSMFFTSVMAGFSTAACRVGSVPQHRVRILHFYFNEIGHGIGREAGLGIDCSGGSRHRNARLPFDSSLTTPPPLFFFFLPREENLWKGVLFVFVVNVFEHSKKEVVHGSTGAQIIFVFSSMFVITRCSWFHRCSWLHFVHIKVGLFSHRSFRDLAYLGDFTSSHS